MKIKAKMQIRPFHSGEEDKRVEVILDSKQDQFSNGIVQLIHSTDKMKNRLVVAVKAVEQRSKDVSPQANPTKKKNDSLTNKKTEFGQMGSTYSCPEAKRISQLFSIQIETPISLHTALDKAGTPQKCLIHDNVITLFCTAERRPICAMCMYQNNTHKSHKVMPIHKANQLLNSELQAALVHVKNQLEKATALISIRDHKINQIEVDYPALMRELQTFYAHIQTKLLEKQTQQLQFLSQNWVQSKQMQVAVGTQLKKVKMYAMERVRQIGMRKKQQSIIFNYNIATQLRKLDLFFGQEGEEIMPNKYFDQIKKFKQLDQIIANLLNLSKESSPKQPQTTKNSKKTFIRQGQPKIKAKNEKNIIENEHNLTPDDNESLDKQQRKEKSPPRNRHAASQVKLKMEMSDRKRQIEKKLQRKSSSLLREKSQSKSKLATETSAVNTPGSKKSPRKQQNPP